MPNLFMRLWTWKYFFLLAGPMHWIIVVCVCCVPGDSVSVRFSFRGIISHSLKRALGTVTHRYTFTAWGRMEVRAIRVCNC